VAAQDSKMAIRSRTAILKAVHEIKSFTLCSRGHESLIDNLILVQPSSEQGREVLYDREDDQRKQYKTQQKHARLAIAG